MTIYFVSSGLKSYGKVVHGFVLAPVAGIFVLTFKMVGVVENTASLFGQTAWVDFFFNTQVSEEYQTLKKSLLNLPQPATADLLNQSFLDRPG